MEETEWTAEAHQEWRAALTTLDLGAADAVITRLSLQPTGHASTATPSKRRRPSGVTVYRVLPGDDGPLSADERSGSATAVCTMGG